MSLQELSLEEYFIRTGFYDLLPLAAQLAEDQGFNQSEMIEAVCKVYDKFLSYPPTRNRTAWFKMVYQEKLHEARGNIFAVNALRR